MASFSVLSALAKILTQNTGYSTKGPLSKLWGSNYSEMRWWRSTLTGVSLTDRSGVYSSWSICSRPLPPWGRGRGSNIETHAPTSNIQRWPWGNRPNPSFHEKPTGVIWGRDPESCWEGVLGEYKLTPSSTPSSNDRRSTWQSYMLSSVSGTWLELASGICTVVARSTFLQQKTLMCLLQSLGLSLHQPRLEEGKWPSGYGKSSSTRWLQIQESMLPGLGTGVLATRVSHSGSKVSATMRVQFWQVHLTIPQALLHPHPTDEQLNHSLSELHLQSLAAWNPEVGCRLAVHFNAPTDRMSPCSSTKTSHKVSAP